MGPPLAPGQGLSGLYFRSLALSFIQQLGSLCSVPVFLSLENAGLGPVLEPCRPQVAVVSLGFSASGWLWAVGGQSPRDRACQPRPAGLVCIFMT